LITELSVENLAIIHAVTLKFKAGFTVITGETGAGKSLMIDAVELALGARADSDLVRTGESNLTVNFIIDVTNRQELKSICQSNNIATDDDLLRINREVQSEGRSVARVNSKQVSVSVLKELGNRIVDLHGQHQHQSLLNPSAHINYFDAWIGKNIDLLKSESKVLYESLSAERTKLEHLKENIKQRDQKIDSLKFQINEIENFQPVDGEIADLKSTLSRTRNAEKIVSALQGALQNFESDEINGRDLLANGVKKLHEISKFDSEINETVSNLETILVQLDEQIRNVQNYYDVIESDPVSIEVTVERLDGYKKLQRRYGETETEILSFLVSAQEELSTLVDSELSLLKLESLVKSIENKHNKVCADITDLRKSKSLEFEQSVKSHLSDLSMAHAQFLVHMTTCTPNEDGADSVEYFFNANAGESPKPLTKIASGGEVSRVMLSLKSALAGRAGVPTLIFDEVDTGLGGKAASSVGKKLRDLGKYYQVIAISHLPQVACLADHHYRIEKIETNSRTETTISELSLGDREIEIARMLAGDIVTDASLANARALMNS
jgi:DNA repair protein RecN (Recombination protein N)